MSLKTQKKKENILKHKLKIRIIIGYLAMLLGIALPLASFSALTYFEWKANSRYDEFLKGVQTQSSEKLESLKNFQNHYAQSLGEYSGRYIDPFDAKDYKVQYDLANQDPNFIFAYLSIPKLDLRQPIRLGATAEHLNVGAAHLDGTALPVGGVDTRSVIAGHRGMYNNRMFLNLHELQEGDEAQITNVLGQTLIYRVRDKKVVAPTAWDEILPEKGKDLLTLMTCDPWVPPSPNRLLINLEREKPEALPETQIEKASQEDKDIPFSIRATQYGMYIGTLALWLFFFMILWRFIAYLRVGSEEEPQQEIMASDFEQKCIKIQPSRLVLKELWKKQPNVKQNRFYSRKLKAVLKKVVKDKK